MKIVQLQWIQGKCLGDPQSSVDHTLRTTALENVRDPSQTLLQGIFAASPCGRN